MRNLVRIVAGLAVSAVALWLTLRGKDLGAMWEAARDADHRTLAPYLLSLLVIHVLKTVRWGLLLRPVAHVPFGRLNAIAAVGFMAVFILPFRLGELVRPALIAERERLSASAALSSVVLERAADGLFMGVLLVVALLAVPEGTPALAVLRAGAVVVSAALGAFIAFMAFAYRSRARAVALTRRALAPFSRRAAERAAAALDTLTDGLRILPGGRGLGAFVLLTTVYWLVNALGMQLLARGFGLELGLVAACAVLGVLILGIMIPAAPGMIGTFQGAVVLGLSLFLPADAVATRGLAYANVLWAAQLFQVVVVGLLFLPSTHVRLGRVAAARGRMAAALEAEETRSRGAGHAGPPAPTRPS